MVYWVRSLVPMEKKSTSGANWWARSAVAGISTMTPVSMRAGTLRPAAATSAAASASRALAALSSPSVATMGNITFSG